MSYIKELGLNKERISDTIDMIERNTDNILDVFDMISGLLEDETISSMEAAVLLMQIGYNYGVQYRLDPLIDDAFLN